MIINNDYVIDKSGVLGRGSQGIVYKCSSKAQPHLSLCAKILPVQNHSDQIIQRELGIINLLKDKAMNNQNIVRVYHIEQSNTEVIIIMEKCDSDMKKLLQGGRKLSVAQSIDILQQLINGYKVCYDNKILHRDIKPENILYTQTQFKLADFGVGKIDRNSLEMTVIGSPAYQAPQLCLESSEQAYASSKVDVYSLGLVAYQMIFGVLPVKTDSIGNLRESLCKIKSTPVKINPYCIDGMTQEIATLIESMIKFEENDRISWEDLFKHQLVGINRNNAPPKRLSTIIQPPIQPVKSQQTIQPDKQQHQQTMQNWNSQPQQLNQIQAQRHQQTLQNISLQPYQPPQTMQNQNQQQLNQTPPPPPPPIIVPSPVAQLNQTPPPPPPPIIVKSSVAQVALNQTPPSIIVQSPVRPVAPAIPSISPIQKSPNNDSKDSPPVQSKSQAGTIVLKKVNFKKIKFTTEELRLGSNNMNNQSTIQNYHVMEKIWDMLNWFYQFTTKFQAFSQGNQQCKNELNVGILLLKGLVTSLAQNLDNHSMSQQYCQRFVGASGQIQIQQDPKMIKDILIASVKKQMKTVENVKFVTKDIRDTALIIGISKNIQQDPELYLVYFLALFQENFNIYFPYQDNQEYSLDYLRFQAMLRKLVTWDYSFNNVKLWPSVQNSEYHIENEAQLRRIIANY